MPTEEEMRAKAEAARIEQERLEEERRKKAAESAGNNADNYIRILAQAFYGNRTVTEINKARRILRAFAMCATIQHKQGD